MASDNTIGGTKGSCPAGPMNCNMALGDCDVSVATLSSEDGSKPWGHFSASISGTLYSSDTETNGCLAPSGSPTSISLSGGW
jgi:hypothetical protein